MSKAMRLELLPKNNVTFPYACPSYILYPTGCAGALTVLGYVRNNNNINDNHIICKPNDNSR